MAVSQFQETLPLVQAFPFIDASGTFQQTVAIVTTQPYRIDSLYAASTDTVDREFDVTVSCPGTDDFVLGRVTIPAGAGSATVPLVDIFDQLGYKPGALALPASSQIEAAAVVAVSASATVTIFVLGGLL